MLKAVFSSVITLIAWWFIGLYAMQFFLNDHKVQGNGADAIRNGNETAFLVTVILLAYGVLAALINGILYYCATRVRNKYPKTALALLVYVNIIVLPFAGAYWVLRLK